MKRVSNKRILSAMILLIIPGIVSMPGIMAQNSHKEAFETLRNELRAEHEQFRKEKRTEFEQTRKRLNEEFAALLNGKWSLYEQHAKVELPVKPKPRRPLEADNAAPAISSNLPVKEIVAPDMPIPDIPVTLPKPERKKTTRYPVNFTFYNTVCGIRNFDTSLLSVTSTDNKSLSNAWKKLTENENLEPLLEDCLRLREEMRLCDWGFLKLVDQVAGIFYPHSPDSKAFLTVALLSQAGYDCRMVKKNGLLCMSFHSSHTIYNVGFHIIDGKNYYLYGPLADKEGAIHTYAGNFRKDPTPIRMTIDRYPVFTSDPKRVIRYSSASWKEAPPFELSVNPSVIDFFSEYPVVDWKVYGMSAVSPELQYSLFEAMKILTEGLDEEDAVNLLLRFHMHGFKYMRDDDQFGKEKPFFFDENFYYPYNDCEDRAIMFAKLVKSVLGLDVVYIKLPNHLATAVRFSSGVKVKGSSVIVDVDKYMICDPTCSRCEAGFLAPVFSGCSPEVHKIYLK